MGSRLSNQFTQGFKRKEFLWACNQFLLQYVVWIYRSCISWSLYKYFFEKNNSQSSVKTIIAFLKWLVNCSLTPFLLHICWIFYHLFVYFVHKYRSIHACSSLASSKIHSNWFTLLFLSRICKSKTVGKKIEFGICFFFYKNEWISFFIFLTNTIVIQVLL